MKGFKPTGYGPKSGFHFPASAGFTGSTGSVVSVQPYVRRKAFADGGFVRQDNPRMRSEMVGDQGNAMTRRKKPYAEWQRDVGATSSLLPGFRSGGPAGRKMHKADGGAVNAPPKPSKKPNPQPIGSRRAPRKKLPQIGAIKSKFYEDGGKVEKPTYMQAVKDRIKEMLRMEAESSTGLAKKAADKLGGRQRQIDSIADSAESGKTSNYAGGGKTRRTGYYSGGMLGRNYVKAMRAQPLGATAEPPAGNKSRMAMMLAKALSNASTTTPPQRRVGIPNIRNMRSVYADGGSTTAPPKGKGRKSC